MLKNETFFRNFETLCKSSLFMARLLSEFYGTKGSISAAAVSHNVIGRPAKKKKKKKGFFCLLPLSFIISYKIFLEQRSDNNFFLCASTKKGNESLVFSWNLKKKGKKPDWYIRNRGLWWPFSSKCISAFVSGHSTSSSKSLRGRGHFGNRPPSVIPNWIEIFWESIHQDLK